VCVPAIPPAELTRVGDVGTDERGDRAATTAKAPQCAQLSMPYVPPLDTANAQ